MRSIQPMTVSRTDVRLPFVLPGKTSSSSSSLTVSTTSSNSSSISASTDHVAVRCGSTKTKTTAAIEHTVVVLGLTTKSSSPIRGVSESSPTREIYMSRLRTKFRDALALHQHERAFLERESSSSVSSGRDTQQKQQQEHIEAMSLFIYDSMSNTARNYHSVQHVFDLIDGHAGCGRNVLDSLAVLAALFHDCVYATVDAGGVSEDQRQKLRGVCATKNVSSSSSTWCDCAVVTQSPDVRIHPNAADDPLLAMVLSVFCLAPNQVVGSAQNEFLSAVIAVRELQSFLSMKSLIQIAVCIEATIPFRPRNANGERPLDVLYGRLCQTVQELSPDDPWTDHECVQAVQRAALMSNEDVGNFGSTNHTWFLDNTWSLMPEANVSLRFKNMYTVDQFFHAIYKMHGFLSWLKTDLVFQEFQGVPDTLTMTRLQSNCTENLRIATKYLGAKLLSVTFLAALAELTGGDAPISDFMGKLPADSIDNPSSQSNVAPRLEQLLELPSSAHVARCCEADVFDLLYNGRQKETSFDVKHSPLAAYLYSHLGDEGLSRVVAMHTTRRNSSSSKDAVVPIPPLYPMTPDGAHRFLTSLPRDLVQHAGEGMARLAPTRRTQILQVLQSALVWSSSPTGSAGTA